jgi:hypothetical protein
MTLPITAVLELEVPFRHLLSLSHLEPVFVFCSAHSTHAPRLFSAASAAAPYHSTVLTLTIFVQRSPPPPVGVELCLPRLLSLGPKPCLGLLLSLAFIPWIY